MKRFSIFAITLFILLMAIPSALAGCVEDCDFEVETVNIDVDCDAISISWSHPTGTDSGVVVVGADILDPFIEDIRTGNSGSVSHDFMPDLEDGDELLVVVVILNELEEELIAISFFEIIVDCDEASVADDEFVSLCPDGRITYTSCDPLIIYPVITGDGVGWTIYTTERADNMGNFKLYIAAEDFEALPTTSEQNCTIASSDDGTVVVYLLTTGEYQVNVGPDEEGKVFSFIFFDLVGPPSSMDSYVGGLPATLPAC